MPFPSDVKQPVGTLERDAAIMQWRIAKEALEAAKETEMEKRKAVVACFDLTKEGVNTIDLGKGYALKVTQPYNYTLKDTEKLSVDDALDKIEKAGNEGKFIVDRLVKFEPKLSVGEYRKLSPQYRGIIDEVLTVKPGSPQVELVEPKVK